MMTEKKRIAVQPQEKPEKLCDAQLGQVNGGIEVPTLPRTENPAGLKLGQAMKKPTCFSKSDDRFSLSD